MNDEQALLEILEDIARALRNINGTLESINYHLTSEGEVINVA